MEAAIPQPPGCLTRAPDDVQGLDLTIIFPSERPIAPEPAKGRCGLSNSKILLDFISFLGELY